MMMRARARTILLADDALTDSISPGSGVIDYIRIVIEWRIGVVDGTRVTGIKGTGDKVLGLTLDIGIGGITHYKTGGTSHAINLNGANI